MMYQGNALIRPSARLLRKLYHKLIGTSVSYSISQRRLIYLCAANNIKQVLKKRRWI